MFYRTRLSKKVLLYLQLSLLVILVFSSNVATAYPSNTQAHQQVLDRGFETLRWQPNGELIAVAGSDGVWFFDSNLEETFQWETNSTVDSIAWSPDGTSIAAGIGADLQLLNITENRSTTLREGDFEGFPLLAFSPDGTMLVSGGFQNKVEIWSLSNLQEEPFTLQDDHREGYAEFMSAVAWSYNSDLLAMLNEMGNVSIWNVTAQRREQLFELNAISIAWHPSQNLLAVSTRDSTIVLINVNPGITFNTTLDTLQLENGVGSLQWSPDGEMLAGINRNRLFLWDATSIIKLEPSLIIETEQETDYFASLSWSSDSSRIATLNSKEVMCIWDKTTGELQNCVSGIVEL